MARRHREDDDPRLTDAELEIMAALWQAVDADAEAGKTGDVDVGDLCARLGDGRAYTTVATLLKILEQKGFVTSRRDGRRLLYAPATDRPRWERATVADFVQRVFGGDARALVRSLVDSGEVDKGELAAIRRILDGEKP